ncbi:MAG: ATPase [Eubacteriales bacterium]
MDRKELKTLDSILKKISPKERIGAELQDNKLLYSVVGFIPACDFTDNPMLLSNLGYLLSKKGLNTCIVDLKVFYPNLYQVLDVPSNKRGKGLIKVLKSDKVDFRTEIQETNYEKLYLLSPSPQDLMEEYFDFGFENIERVISVLKQMFDIVLLDIPNNPPLEFCLGAINNCHVGFFTASERIEAAGNMIKLLDYAASVGISTAKFTRVILMNMQDLKFDNKSITELGFNIVASLPLIKGANARALEGRLYVKDNPIINKYFNKEIIKLSNLLTEDL